MVSSSRLCACSRVSIRGLEGHDYACTDVVKEGVGNRGPVRFERRKIYPTRDMPSVEFMNVNVFVSQTETTFNSLGTRSQFQYLTPSICVTLKLGLSHVTTPSRCSCHVRRQPSLTITPTNTSRSTRPALREGTPRRRSASHVSGPIIRRSLRDALALTTCD
jgi:hypothetical protein